MPPKSSKITLPQPSKDAIQDLVGAPLTEKSLFEAAQLMAKSSGFGETWTGVAQKEMQTLLVESVQNIDAATLSKYLATDNTISLKPPPPKKSKKLATKAPPKPKKPLPLITENIQRLPSLTSKGELLFLPVTAHTNYSDDSYEDDDECAPPADCPVFTGHQPDISVKLLYQFSAECGVDVQTATVQWSALPGAGDICFLQDDEYVLEGKAICATPAEQAKWQEATTKYEAKMVVYNKKLEQWQQQKGTK